MPSQKKLVNIILRTCIETKGIKFSAISKATKIKYDTLICYLTKGQTIPFDHVNLICEYIGIDTNYIFKQYKEIEKGE